jgi:hypothetical protein
MQKAVQVLRSKSVDITDLEEDALYKAILLHDIGHGPFSHALEHQIVGNVTHEQLSCHFMNYLNTQFNGSLTLAIEIFKGQYHRPFMLELISSQLDMDRLDYLKRDSFYTGVAEGNINSQRLITMLNVVDDQLVVEEKGLYSVENFLSGRRLMYWQVYLHKTGIGAEHLLQSVIKRIKELIEKDIFVELPKNFGYFINNKKPDFSSVDLERFALLDDSDVIMTLKCGSEHKDIVLSELCKMILNRQLLKIKLSDKPIPQEKVDKHLQRFMSNHNLTSHEASYFVFSGVVHNTAYTKTQPIRILNKSEKLVELIKAGKEDSFKALLNKVQKYYCCYPKLQD